jgi:hypothetical protein
MKQHTAFVLHTARGAFHDLPAKPQKHHPQPRKPPCRAVGIRRQLGLPCGSNKVLRPLERLVSSLKMAQALATIVSTLIYTHIWYLVMIAASLPGHLWEGNPVPSERWFTVGRSTHNTETWVCQASPIQQDEGAEHAGEK